MTESFEARAAAVQAAAVLLTSPHYVESFMGSVHRTNDIVQVTTEMVREYIEFGAWPSDAMLAAMFEKPVS